MDEHPWEISIYTGLSNSQPVHERVLQLMYFPYTCSEVQINIQRRFFLGEPIRCGDGVQLVAVEPVNQKLKDFGVLFAESDKALARSVAGVTDSLAEPFILSQ